jgi:hypothetical protein
MTKQYPLSSGARTGMIVVGVLCCLVLLAIPLGIWVFYRLGKAKVTLSPEGLEAVNIFSSTRYAWTDVARLGLMQVAMAKDGGMAGALARESTGGNSATHLIVKTNAGDNRSFLVSNYDEWQDILDQVEQRVGKPYEAVTPGAAGAMGAKWP